MGLVSLCALLALWIPLLPTNLFVPLEDLGKLTGYTWESTVIFGGFIVGLFGLYITGMAAVERCRPRLRVILLTMLLAGGCLVLAYPATAVDVFGYVAQGRELATYGANPFTVPPSRFPADPILPYLAFRDEPSQYGPLWAIVGAGVSKLGNGSLAAETLLYKVIGLAAQAVSTVLVYRVASILRPSSASVSAWAFGLNPLLLWEMVGNAHNDGVMMCLGLLGAWLMLRGGDLGALGLAAAALGALVKLPVAFLWPFLAVAVWRSSPLAAAAGTLASVAATVTLYRPFWVGAATLTALGRGDLFTTSLASIGRILLAPSLGEAQAEALVHAVSTAGMGLIGLWLVAKVLIGKEQWAPYSASYWALLSLMLLGVTWFQAWYVVWPIALGAALGSSARRSEIVLLSFGAMGTYVVYIYLWVMGALPNNPLSIQGSAYGVLILPLVVLWSVRATLHGRNWRPRPHLGSPV